MQVDDERKRSGRRRGRQRHVHVERHAVETLDARRERAGTELDAVARGAGDAAAEDGRDRGRVARRAEEGEQRDDEPRSDGQGARH